ncbi:MAG: phosphotransferase [Actinomycetota bacterium]|nr:phosphotransferase [Actinomycetota bacterium]
MNEDGSDARRAAIAMCHRAGLSEVVGKLLRFGNNAVFALGEAYVLRVMPPSTSRADVQQEIDLAREFARLDVPVAHLAELDTVQPLEAHDRLGTVWERLEEPDRDQLYQPFGQLLRTFHQRTAGLRVPLGPWRPLASTDRRLAQLHGHYSPADMAMLKDWSERIAAELDQVEPALPRGVIHGQAEVGNILLRAGDPVFIDLERVATGPREWDLVDTAVTVDRFGLPEQRYRDFAAAYDFDVRAWNGYQTYRRLWELRAITWLMQHIRRSPEVTREIEVRLQSWRDDDPDTQWSSVLERNPGA